MSQPLKPPRFLRGFTWQPWHSGLSAGLAVAATLAAAAPTPDDARVTTALVLAAALLTASSHAAKRVALLWGILAGIALGILSSLEFLVRPDVADRFTPVAASLAMFLILGLSFGVFAEAVRVIHRAVHRSGVHE